MDGQYSELSRAIFMDFFSPDCSLLSLRVRCLGIDICARLLLDVSFAAVAAHVRVLRVRAGTWTWTHAGAGAVLDTYKAKTMAKTGFVPATVSR